MKIAKEEIQIKMTTTKAPEDKVLEVLEPFSA